MPVLPLGETRLRDQQAMTVLLVRPPVDLALAGEIHELTNRELAERFHRDVLTGALAGEDSARYFIGRVGGRLVGTSWLGVSPANPEVGCLGGVSTLPAFRRRGVAKSLCQAAVDDFRARGGVALYLAFANDVARGLYERMGFAVLRGRIMRQTPPGRDFDRENFAPAQVRRIIPVAWRDLARTVPLYAYPHEWYSLDAVAGLHSTRYVPGDRCIGLFREVWDVVHTMGGVWRLVEADGRRVVGAGTMYPGNRQRGVIDFVLHPDHVDVAGELIESLAAAASRAGLMEVRALMTMQDEAKRGIVRDRGFQPEGKGVHAPPGFLAFVRAARPATA